MSSLQKIELPEPGQRIGVVDGPGQWPEERAGIVLCQITDRWGTHAVVLMDDGKTKDCHGLMRGPGIGWHLVHPAA